MRKISMAFWLFFLVTISAFAEDDSRQYPVGLFSESLPEDIVHRVKQFDRLAFRHESDVFEGIGKRAGQRFGAAHPYVSYYAADFWPLGNRALLGAFSHISWLRSPGFGQGQTPEKSDILFLPIVEPNNPWARPYVDKILKFSKMELSLTEILTAIKSKIDEPCIIIRQQDGTDIVRSVVFVRVKNQDMTIEETLEAVACINRGFYYHVGFSNALNLPNSAFAFYNESTGSYHKNPDFPLWLPMSLLNGANTGVSRIEALKLYLSELESKYEQH